jgi:hypothetical protein
MPEVHQPRNLPLLSNIKGELRHMLPVWTTNRMGSSLFITQYTSVPLILFLDFYSLFVCLSIQSYNYQVILKYCDCVSQISITMKKYLNNLKGGKLYFDSQFQRFQFIVTSLYHFGPVVRPNIMVGTVW